MVFVLAQAVNAADGTYTSQTGAWNLTGSWSDGTIADGTDSTAFFTNDVTTANRTTSLGEDRTIGHIVFTDSVSSHNRTIANNILTFDVTSGRSTIDVTQSNRQLIFDSQLSGDDGLRLIGPGLVRFNNSSNDYSGGTEINAGALWLAASGTIGSGTILLGNTTGSDNAELRMSSSGTTISNALEVRAGSSGTKTLANRSTNSVNFSGTITANDNLAIPLAGATGGGVFSISGAGNSIAASKMVSFEISGGGTGRIADGALWSGEGSISYTSNTTKGYTVTGAKTYSGGATLGSMSGTGAVVIQTSSTGPANAPTDGPFGTGTLTIGATKMRGLTTADITIGNAVTFTDNPTFTTVAGEKSLIFTGNVNLGADRTLTVETGSTVAGTFVGFSGGISGSGFGITKAGAGRLVLSGTNTYTGATQIDAGILNFANKGARSAATTVTAAAAGSVGLGVHDSDTAYYSATEVELLFNTNTLAGFSLDAASGVAIDTTNAGGSFAQTTALTAARSLTKLGTGTLSLSAANTYTGATQIDAGILNFANKAAMSATTTVTAAAAGSVGLGVHDSDTAYYSATEVELLFNTNTLAGFSLDAASGVAIDTTNAGGSFAQTTALTAARSLTKLGTGTLSLSAANTYTGNTIVSAGALELAANGQLKFVLGGASGENNRLTGAGTATLNGSFVIDTLAADALSSGAWTLVDVSGPASEYGSTFSVVDFDPIGTDKWEKPLGGGKKYTFDETTGVLELSAGNTFAAWISDPGFGIAPENQGPNDDPDGDGIANGLENFFGTHPGEFSQGVLAGTKNGNSFTFTHPQNATPASDLTSIYRWSTNLIDWYAGDNLAGPGGGLTVNIVPSPAGPSTTSVTATASQPVPQLFLRVEVTQD
jgi:autotransporter-associated beta strand protein